MYDLQALTYALPFYEGKTQSEIREKTIQILGTHAFQIPWQAYINLLASISPLLDMPLDIINVGRRGVGKDRVTRELLKEVLNLPHVYVFHHLTFASFRDQIAPKYSKYCVLNFPEMNSLFRGGESSMGMVEFLKGALDHSSVRVKLKTEEEVYIKRFRSSIIGNINTIVSRNEDHCAALSRAMFVPFPSDKSYTKAVVDYLANQNNGDIYNNEEWKQLRYYLYCLNLKAQFADFEEHKEGRDYLKEVFKEMCENIATYIDPRDFLLARKLAILDAFFTSGIQTEEKIPVTEENFHIAANFMEDSMWAKSRYIISGIEKIEALKEMGYKKQHYPIEVVCANCGNTWHIGSGVIRKDLKCPKCGNKI
ncbi:MAG: hypothetical protein ACTSX6_00180 [Candidatus Heimdallarchaeaceae archaeon]